MKHAQTDTQIEAERLLNFVVNSLSEQLPIYRSCRKVLQSSIITDSLEERHTSGVQSEGFPVHATIDVRLTVSIDDDKTIPLATLAEFITDQKFNRSFSKALTQ